MSNWMLDNLLGVADTESHNDVSDREDIVSTPARARRTGRRIGANPGADLASGCTYMQCLNKHNHSL